MGGGKKKFNKKVLNRLSKINVYATYTAPAEKPKWDADMDMWLSDDLEVLRNLYFHSSRTIGGDNYYKSKTLLKSGEIINDVELKG